MNTSSDEPAASAPGRNDRIRTTAKSCSLQDQLGPAWIHDEEPSASRQLLYTGILEAIVEVGQREIRSSNGIMGPGYSSTVSGYEPYAKLSIRTEKEGKMQHRIEEYKGIILPDSIGNQMGIYREVLMFPVPTGPVFRPLNDASRYVEVRHGKHILHDQTLDRWYL